MSCLSQNASHNSRVSHVRIFVPSMIAYRIPSPTPSSSSSSRIDPEFRSQLFQRQRNTAPCCAIYAKVLAARPISWFCEPQISEHDREFSIIPGYRRRLFPIPVTAPWSSSPSDVTPKFLPDVSSAAIYLSYRYLVSPALSLLFSFPFLSLSFPSRCFVHFVHRT